MSTDTAANSSVVVSHPTVAPEGASALEDAFRRRLGEIDGVWGLQRLEVWHEAASPSSYAMMSWWDCETDFRACMGSEVHRRSHARISRDPHAPHATAVHR